MSERSKCVTSRLEICVDLTIRPFFLQSYQNSFSQPPSTKNNWKDCQLSLEHRTTRRRKFFGDIEASNFDISLKVVLENSVISGSRVPLYYRFSPWHFLCSTGCLHTDPHPPIEQTGNGIKMKSCQGREKGSIIHHPTPTCFFFFSFR